MSFGQRLQEIREGFEPAFWVANITEIFERFSYYAAFAILALYLHEGLKFSNETTTGLTGWFGSAVWFLAIFGGTAADKLGFRRALSLAYLVLSAAYFLIGSLNSSAWAPVSNAISLKTVVFIVLLLPAFGIGLVKPCVVGTTARASSDNVRSIGYSIYYTLVNIGSTLGPLLAGWISERLSMNNVFRVAAGSVFLMFFFTLLFFREPTRSGAAPVPSFGELMRNFRTVFSNVRFLVFLLIFSGYWIVFWQQYIILPLYLTQYIHAAPKTAVKILSVDPLIVICFTVLINLWTRKMPAFTAIVVGTLVTSLGWVFLALQPTVWAAVASLVVLALGEIIQSPRYYEYVSRLAPPGQQGTYMGFAFLPIGIGSLFGGKVAGYLIHRFGEVSNQPSMMWWSVTGIGVLTAALLFVYDRVVKPSEAAAS